MNPTAIAIYLLTFSLFSIAFFSTTKWLKLLSGFLGITCIIFLLLLSSVKIGQRFHLQDETGQFQFTLVPSKGTDFNVLDKRVASYKQENNIQEPVKLYRTKKKNYLDPSMWTNYATNPYWDYEYLEPNRK